MDELVEYINAPKNYDDTEFLQKFCAYDVPGMTKAICHQFLFKEKSSLLDIRQIPDNGKKNVVLYAGNLEKNGITTSAMNLLSMVDKSKYNYAVLFKINAIKKKQECIKVIPEGVSTISYYHARSATLWETFCYMLYQEFRLLPYRWMRPLVEKVARREYGRIMGSCRVDKVIQFFGYEHEIIELMECAPCSRSIFVHNDMEEEIRSKHTLIRRLLSKEYRKYDNVAIVTEDLRESTRKISRAYRDEDTKEEANLVLVKNTIDYKSILEKAKQELVFDEKTKMNVEEEDLRAALASNKKKFILFASVHISSNCFLASITFSIVVCLLKGPHFAITRFTTTLPTNNIPISPSPNASALIILASSSISDLIYFTLGIFSPH